jgi:hypothetical protein
MILNEPSTSTAGIPRLLWSDRQVAVAIGMSVKRAQELARLGLLPGFKLGRKWRFDPDAIRAWIKRNVSARNVCARRNPTSTGSTAKDKRTPAVQNPPEIAVAFGPGT